MLHKNCLLAVVGLAATATVALAHSGATGIVKERMDAMSEMGKIVKDLAAMMRGEKTYDAKVVRAGAALIGKHSGNAMSDLFPKGSKHGASEAREEIWTNWEEFNDLSNRLEVFAAGLSDAADNGLMVNNAGSGTSSSNMMTGGSMMGGSMMGQSMMGGSMMAAGTGVPDQEMLASMPADGVFNMVTQTCSACHTKFRLEKK
jgi:cytochrome c556